jgi:hypothetical protein
MTGPIASSRLDLPREFRTLHQNKAAKALSWERYL